MKQIGKRYRVREDPSFHKYWCIIDRQQLFIVDATPYFHRKYNPDWSSARVFSGIKAAHFTDFNDAIAFVKLLEKSDACNRMG